MPLPLVMVDGEAIPRPNSDLTGVKYDTETFDGEGDHDVYGLKILEQPKSQVPELDSESIIAVHGLCAGSESSWLESSQNNDERKGWLNYRLFKRFPRSRIFFYRYNQMAFRDTTSFNLLLEDLALRLLSELNQLRPHRDSDDHLRPIIFMGHDIGGIIIKKALIMATCRRPYLSQYGGIGLSCRLVVFFGCPHRCKSPESLQESIMRLLLEADIHQNLLDRSRLWARAIIQTSGAFRDTKLILRSGIFNIHSESGGEKVALFDKYMSTCSVPFHNRIGTKEAHKSLPAVMKDDKAFAELVAEIDKHYFTRKINASSISIFLLFSSANERIQIPTPRRDRSLFLPIHKRVEEWQVRGNSPIFHISGSSVVSECTDDLFYHLENLGDDSGVHREPIWFKFYVGDFRYNSTVAMLNSFVVQLWSQMQDLDSSLSDAISSGSLFKAWTKHDLWRLFHVFLTRQGMYRHTFIVNHLEQAEDGGRWFLDKLRELSDTSEWPFKFIILSSPHECLEAALKDYEGMNLDLLIQGSAISGHRENGLMVEEQHVHVPLETENAESMPCNDIGMQDGATNYVRSPPGRATPPRAGWSTEKLILSRSKTDTAQAYLDSISEEWRAWTRDILHLVLFARRSLTPLELGDALSIRLKLNNNSTKTYPCSDLERSLGDYFKDILVIADDEVHFIHQSLRDCLTTSLTSSNDKWYSISPSDANREIFDLCFHCIGTRPHTQIDISFSGSSAVNYVIPPDRSAFQSYAAKHWPAHFNEVQADRHPLWSAQAVKKIMDLFEDMETFRWLSQHYWHTSNPFLRPDCSFLSPLPIASALGLCVVVTYMLERERQSSFFETDCGLALVEAARCGHMDVAMLLVKACVPSLPVLQESVLRAAYGDHETLAQYLFTQTKIRGPVQWSPEILQRVAYLGFAEMVKSLCESGPDIHIPIGRLTSPLYLAAVNNQVEVINLLLDHGADIEVADETGLTPLGGACLSGQDEAVRALLAHGARLDARDSSHNRPLEIASMLGFHKVVQTLINSGAELGPDRETPRPGLVSAAAYGFEKCVRELLDAGADPNREGPYGNALVYAVDDGKISLCKLLIERGAKVNGTNPKFPILNVGVTQDSIEMVRLLVESGADIEIEDDDGESPLTLAAGLESKTITEYLLDHGADVNHANKWGETALFIAARECRTETVRALLNVHDVDVNTARVKHSYAPIHSGVDSVEIIDMLLEKNANINAMSGSGTPLYLASKHDLKETVECLLSHGANTEIECDLVDDTLCRTALSIAVEFGNTSSIRLLLDAGANINKPMQDGVSALAAAMHIGNEDVLKMLLEYQPRLDAIDLRHNTALIMMKDSTPLSMVKRLVRRGANLEIANDFGITPLSRAIFLGRADIVRYLLLKHARVDVHLPNSGSLLHVACRSGNLEIVKMMTEHRLDVNEICDERGGTPLQSAFLGLWYKPVASQMEIIDFLVHEKKVDLNANGGFYGYALNVACAIAPAETINMLLEKGARLDVEDLMGRHPIHFASLRPLEFLLTLIRQNADISAMDRVDRTALHWAIIGGHVEVVRSLLEMSNIGVNSRDKDNWTPLLWALKNSGQWIFHQVTETKSEASTPGSKSDAESQRRKYNEAQEVMERLWVLHKPNKSGLHVGENGSAQEQIVRLLLSHGAKESVYGYFRGQRWSAVAIAMYHGASDRILGLIAPDPTYTSKKKTVHSSGYRIQHSARKAKKQDIWCDSCLLEVWGHWYHCNKCFDFDLCSKCYGCRSDLHPGHTFLEKGDEFDETSDEADELRGGIGVDQKTGEVSSLSDVGGEGVEELTGSMMKAIVNSDSVADEEKKI